MKLLNNFIGGLTGAIVLNLIHESVRRFDPLAPRVDLVGEEALSKTILAAGGEPPTGDKLYAATLVSDIVSNAMYFSMIGAGNDKNIIWRGAGYSLAAGLGAVKLTEPMGLDDTPVNKTRKTQALTIAWYLIGGLVTAATIKAIRKRS